MKKTKTKTRDMKSAGASRKPRNGSLADAKARSRFGIQVGQCYLIRLVTFAWVGRVVDVGPLEITLEDASWVADTGRFHLALRDGLEAQSPSEIEPAPGLVVFGRGALVDASPYNHPLPTAAK